jgi:hypothetical protein
MAGCSSLSSGERGVRPDHKLSPLSLYADVLSLQIIVEELLLQTREMFVEG